MKIAYTEAYKLIYENNLLIIEARRDGIEIEKQHVIECYQAAMQLTEGKKYLVLSLPNKIHPYHMMHKKKVCLQKNLKT